MSYFKKSQKRTIPLPTVADDVILAIQAMDLSQSLISNKENNYKIKDEKSDTNEDNNSNTTELNSYSGSLTPTTSTCSTSESVKTRNPKCARCQNHGEEVLVKGHKRKCKHRECICERCILTVERQKLMAKTIRVKRRAKEDMIDPNMTDDQRFPKPVFKKHRSEISETDRESAYNSDSDKNKDMDTKLKEYFSMIENEIKKT
ncbi:protein male abnormal 3-like [Oppia nitens]|uniref:protein male abnormal 3-like n=1 Tax=Oppia nitens TaxID=1686743 RepID=UPI0023DC8267|nr:protein male abnormal 3-like [Oppia nitens]